MNPRAISDTVSWTFPLRELVESENHLRANKSMHSVVCPINLKGSEALFGEAFCAQEGWQCSLLLQVNGSSKHASVTPDSRPFSRRNIRLCPAAPLLH